MTAQQADTIIAILRIIAFAAVYAAMLYTLRGWMKR